MKNRGFVFCLLSPSLCFAPSRTRDYWDNLADYSLTAKESSHSMFVDLSDYCDPHGLFGEILQTSHNMAEAVTTNVCPYVDALHGYTEVFQARIHFSTEVKTNADLGPFCAGLIEDIRDIYEIVTHMKSALSDVQRLATQLGPENEITSRTNSLRNSFSDEVLTSWRSLEDKALTMLQEIDIEMFGNIPTRRP